MLEDRYVLAMGLIIVVLLFVAAISSHYASQDKTAFYLALYNSPTLYLWNSNPTPANVRFDISTNVTNPWNRTMTLFLIYNASLLKVESNLNNGTSQVKSWNTFQILLNVTTLQDIFQNANITVKGLVKT